MKNRKKRMRRGLAVLLAAALIGNAAGVSVSAQNDFTDGTEAAVQSEPGTVSEPAGESQTLPAEAPAEAETAPVEEPAETETQPPTEAETPDAAEEPAETETQPSEEPAEAETQPAEEPAETETPDTTETPAEAETAPVEEPMETETQPAEMPTETPQAEICICTEACTGETVNADCPVCGAEGADLAECKGVYEAEVTIDGTTTQYGTLLEALNAANGKTATVTMLRDVEDEYDGSSRPFWTMTGGNITLDMNGHTLIGNHGLWLENSSWKDSLTITGEGNIQSSGLVVKQGRCTVENGTFSLIGIPVVGVISVLDQGEVDIKGGTFSGDCVVIATNSYGNSTISGGTFEELVFYPDRGLKITGGRFGKISGEENASVSTYLAGGYTLYDYTENQWVTDPDKLTAASIEHVEVKQIPVSISAQPQDRTVYYSQGTESLEVTARTIDGAGPVSYQWYRAGTGADGGDEAISGAVEAQFRIPGDLDVGTYGYYCIAACDGYPAKSDTATVTVQQSGIEMGEIRTCLGEEEQTAFFYGETITVKAAPASTGAAPDMGASARAAFQDPAADQMAVYNGSGVQISEPAQAAEDGTYTMTVDSTDLALGEQTLTVRYEGGNMASAEAGIRVTVKGAARAGEQEYGTIEEAWAAAKEKSRNGTAVTVTLLTDVSTGTALTVEKDEKIVIASAEGQDFTLTGTAAGNFITVSSGGFLTLRSGAVKNTDDGANVIDVNGGKFSVEGGAVEGVSHQNSGILVEREGTAEILSGRIRGYYGVALQNNVTTGTLTVSGGTIGGFQENGSFTIFIRNGRTLRSLLAEGKAYYRGEDTAGELITEGLDEISLSGSVVVTAGDCRHSGEWITEEDSHTRECTVCGETQTGSHTVETWADQKDGTHSGSCSVCGYTETAEHTRDGSSLDCPDCQITFAASVEVNGEEALFAAIEQAWAYAKKKSSEENAATVTLLADATVTKALYVEKGDCLILTSADGAKYRLDMPIDDGTAIRIQGGTFEMTGGSVSGDLNGMVIDGGEAALRGGEVTGRYAVWMYRGEALIDSGCVITGTKSGLYMRGSGKAMIRGGQFTATTGTGVELYENAGAEISGGTFKGETYSISNQISGNNVKDILAAGKAYYQGEDTTGELITEGLDGTELTGTVTVGDCTHSVTEWTDQEEDTHAGVCAVCGQEVIKSHSMTAWTDQKDGTHSGSCSVCGYTGTAEHTWDKNQLQCPDCHAEAAARVETAGEEALFSTIEQAWAYAKEKNSEENAATVTLLADAAASERLTVENGNHIILTCPEGAEYTLSGSIQISGGTFELAGGIISSNSWDWMDGSTIYVTGGRALLRGTIISNLSFGVELVDGSEGEVEISSGCVVTGKRGGVCADGGKLLINGGKITGDDYNGILAAFCSVEINGGVIEGGQVGLTVAQDVSAKLSGGTFKGGNYSIFNQVYKNNVKDILAAGKAYYQGEDTTGKLITEGLDGEELTGTVTVGDCIHSITEWTDQEEDTHAGVCAVCGQEVIKSHSMTAWTDQKDGTHSGSCSVCGYTGTAEHTWNGSSLDCPECQITFAASVEVNGEEALFAAIEQAWAYAKEKSSEENAATVTLLADAAASERLTVENGSHILLTCPEGAKHTLSGAIQISGGTFELAGGTLSCDSESLIGYSTVYVTGGRALLRGGTIISKSNEGVELEGGSEGEVVISSGCVVAGKRRGVLARGGKLLINGGKITGDDYNGIYVASCSVEISGGIIEGGQVGLTVAENVSAKLSGGTFKGEIYSISNQVSGNNVKNILAEGCDYYDADGQYIAVTETTGDLTQKEVTVKNPDVVAYTITIPRTAIAGGDAVSIGINKEQTFNLNGGAVNVSVSGGIKDGKLTLADKANAANTVTSALYVLKPGEAEEQPVTSYENGVLASFTNMDDPAVSLSFKEPAEINIPIGTYEGIVTFSIDYTEAQQ